tara:strand:+ start:1108 stop:1578 length:471 start_codon:yes stop_codon:yes gene_type:complete
MLKKYLYTLIACSFSVISISDEVTHEEMINFIVKEQVISQQEQTMRDSMYSMLMMFGMDLESDEMNDFLDPFIQEYVSSVEKKMRNVYKSVYSEKEIVAMYNFMNTEDGKSINSKQAEMVKKTLAAVNEDALRVGQKLSSALMEDSKFFESLLEQN